MDKPELSQEQIDRINSQKSKNGNGKVFGSNQRPNPSFDVTDPGEPTGDIQRIEEINAQERNLKALQIQSANEMAAVADGEQEGRIQARREDEAYFKGYADQKAINQERVGAEMAKLRNQRKQALEFAHSTNGSEARNDSFSSLAHFDMEAFKRQVLEAKAAPKN